MTTQDIDDRIASVLAGYILTPDAERLLRLELGGLVRNIVANELKAVAASPERFGVNLGGSCDVVVIATSVLRDRAHKLGGRQ